MQSALTLDADLPASPPDPTARSLEALSVMAWALPLAFAVSYAFAWTFSAKNFLLLVGHLAALVLAGGGLECADRLRVQGPARGPALGAVALFITAALVLVYALVPTIRGFMAPEASFFSPIESADPVAALARATFVAASTLAAGLGALVVALQRAGRGLDINTRGLRQVWIAGLVAAGLAAVLHGAYGYKEALRELRHPLAFAFFASAAWAGLRARPVLLRLAAAVRHRSARAERGA